MVANSVSVFSKIRSNKKTCFNAHGASFVFVYGDNSIQKQKQMEQFSLPSQASVSVTAECVTPESRATKWITAS